VSSDKYPKSFYYYQLSDYIETFKKIAEARKTTMGHITSGHLRQSKILIPPTNLINLLEDNIKVIFDSIIRNKEENQRLVSARDWILPMLMNGQVFAKDQS
jgi:type I restriction enzyme S subunit